MFKIIQKTSHMPKTRPTIWVCSSVQCCKKDSFRVFSVKKRVLKLRCSAFLWGSGGFKKVREACRNNFHLSWYLSDAVVPTPKKGLIRLTRFPILETCYKLHCSKESSLDAIIDYFRPRSQILRQLLPIHSNSEVYSLAWRSTCQEIAVWYSLTL